MRTDPTDNGGLFVGRRPGTKPVVYRTLPQRADARRQSIDRALAGGILALMVVANLSFWGPIPIGWLWVGGHVQGWTGNVGAAILVAFAGMLFTLIGGLVLLKYLDATWILVRRAAGYDQRAGTIGRIFVITCGIGTICFATWFFIFSGAEFAPVGINI